MLKLILVALCSTAAAFGGRAKSPAWLSIESPVNPYDQSTRGDVLLVHAVLHTGNTQLTDLTGTAEGLVNGSRRAIGLHFDSTSRPNVFGLRRQWPSEGTWILRISLRETTAIVTFDRTGAVASAIVPTTISSGIALPRAVTRSEVDSALAAAAHR
jgi:hypothetical protein